MDEIQKVPDVIYLPWLDAAWCVERIYETDIEYVPKAALDDAEQRAAEAETQLDSVWSILCVILDQIDYTSGNCQLMSPVGSIISRELLKLAREREQAAAKWLEEHSPHEHG